MIDLRRVAKDELNLKLYKLHGQLAKARFETSPRKKPLTKAHALFYKELKATKADESKINVTFGKLQISFLVRRSLAAKFTPKVQALPIMDGSLTTTSLVPPVQITVRLFLKPM